MTKRSIHLKAYRHPDGGREVHYAAARLRREPGSSAATILDPDDPAHEHASSKLGACWAFFYPMGPSRRLLDAIVARYAPKFESDKDVLFLCVNRPGKGGTSSSANLANEKQEDDETEGSSERQHIQTTCDDLVAILNHYNIGRTNILYMCAGSTFAYAFASKYPERTTGYIVGIASWVLRSDPDDPEVAPTPQRMNSWTHRTAMSGIFGPKWLVSWIAGGVTGSLGLVLGSLPPGLVGKELKKELSPNERALFEERYPGDGGDAEFVEIMKWIHGDGCDEETSTFVNGEADDGDARGNDNDGNAKDVAVCLSTQQELEIVYKTAVAPQKQVLLWHGEKDSMISVLGAAYLEAEIPNATLTIISGGTHQGVMFFIPDDVMEALNTISRDVSV
ncbi:hypothetical protein ACHAXT_010568 [Thalassiosira profunda]